MLPTTHSETHVLIFICTPQKAYPRFYDAILSTKYFDDESELAYYGYRYYSPEMGRWTRRDPVAEKGQVATSKKRANSLQVLNPFLYCDNAVIDRIDSLGLITIPLPSAGTCGPDITTRLDATLPNIRSTYDGWNICQKGLACTHIFNIWGPSGGAKAAWDILPFTGMGALVPSLGANDADTLPGGTGLTPGTGDCKHSLMYKGKCYKAGLLNFIMWGTINKKCSNTFGWSFVLLPGTPNPWSLTSTLTTASLYKALLASPPVTSVWVHAQVAGCVTAGYTTGPVTSAPAGSLANCSAGSGAVGGSGSLKWVWELNKPRAGQIAGW